MGRQVRWVGNGLGFLLLHGPFKQSGLGSEPGCNFSVGGVTRCRSGLPPPFQWQVAEGGTAGLSVTPNVCQAWQHVGHWGGSAAFQAGSSPPPSSAFRRFTFFLPSSPLTGMVCSGGRHATKRERTCHHHQPTRLLPPPVRSLNAWWQASQVAVVVAGKNQTNVCLSGNN